MSRPREHIRMSEKLASALADKLPQHHRDSLRTLRVPAQEVIRLFTPDHIHLHTFGGQDVWWNLDMRLRGSELKAKDARDTSIAAKAIRIDKNSEAFRARLLAKDSGESMPRRSRIQSRGFDKGQRKMGRRR